MSRETVYARQNIQRSNGKRGEIVKAFDKAWKNGTQFSISMKDEGFITIYYGRQLIATYNDAEAFAADFMPEILE
jgi:hypothetical protein